MLRFLTFFGCLTAFTISFLSAQEQSDQNQPLILPVQPDVRKVEVSPDFLPGAVCFFGEKSFPLVLGQTTQTSRRVRSNVMMPIAAVSYYEKGCVALFGHSGMIDKNFVESNAHLFIDTIQKIARREPAADIPQIAVVSAEKIEGIAVGMLHSLRNMTVTGVSSGTQSSPSFRADYFASLTDAALSEKYDVLICSADRIQEDQIEKVQRFVKNGGGLITAATGWGWQQLNPAKDLRTDFIGNKLVAPMGIVWTNQMADRPQGGFLRATDPVKNLHPKEALELLLNKDSVQNIKAEDWAQIISTIELALGSIPEAQAGAFSALHDLIDRQVMPTKAKPIIAADQPLDRIAMILQTQQYMHRQSRGGLPEGLAIPKFAAAADFPGDVPKEAKRINEKTVQIDTKIPDWHSTGLYAAPGEVITVTLPKTAAESGRFSIRIGAQSDELWKLAAWTRYPEISLAVQVTKPVTKVVNPFGGNVYIVVPRNVPQALQSNAGMITAKIEGAVLAPFYVLGETTDEQWAESRQAPAPWAELASDRVIITVPSHLIRELENPKAVLEFWNSILDADAELVGVPTKRRRPERITADRQISAGWMHSGYPVMTPTQTEQGLVDLPYLHEGGDRWGFFHEFGHNHQNRDWVFNGSTEVTVNLFTLNNFVHQCDTPIDVLRPEMRPEVRKAAKAKYLAEGAPFAKWKNDPFLALGMYIELIEAFGWDTLKNVLAQYNGLSPSERPKNDDEKRDQWMCRYSRQAGKNLGPFFDQWGVPVSQSAKDSIADLPVWLPEESPDVPAP